MWQFRGKVDGPLNSYPIDEFVGWVWNMLVLLVDNTVMISNLVSQAVRPGIKMAPGLIKLALHSESSKLSQS